MVAAEPASRLTSPKEHFGFEIGDDYQLASYTQTEAYFKRLAGQSDRLRLVDIGPTQEGRRQYMMICTAPANYAKLDRYREIARRLARAEDLTEEQAAALAAEGRAVVWIDGGLHSTETVGTHQLIESIWRFASRTDTETLRILDQVIILFAHANPDGQELVTSWYMRHADPKKRSLAELPRLYQKYAGHDNNRDFYMFNLQESNNLARQFYHEWFPQVVYNHHQDGPAGTIIAGPPYRDPFNYVYDPLIVTSLDQIGAALHSRLIAENKPGSTMRRGAVFSTWWNGGLRTAVYFHNMIGILTEIAGGPTPMQIPLVAERQMPSGDLPYPVSPQTWHYRTSIEYSVSMNYAVLNYVARQRDEVLLNIYRMGRNSIERGSRDCWTPYPSRVAAMRAAAEKEKAEAAAKAATSKAGDPPSPPRAGIPRKFYDDFLRKAEQRDPRGYIISRDQPDFPTAVHFLNTLVKSGIALHRATSTFTVNGRTYPAGSYVVKTAQAFRPAILDAFEPQDHPNDFQYEGGAPIPPYDCAGWTLAYQMGVKFDRVLDAFDGPFERLPYGELQQPPAGCVEGTGVGVLVGRAPNHGVILVNRLLRVGAEVYWLREGVPGDSRFGPGTLYVPLGDAVRPVLERSCAELGVDAVAVPSRPAGDMMRLIAPRVALVDQYGGSMPSGWTRQLLERFEFGFEVVYPPDIDTADLRARFDALVFMKGAIPRYVPKGETADTPRRGPRPEDVPEEYRSRLGRLSADKSVPALKKFLEAGGTIVAVGNSTNLAYHLDLPVRNALTELGPDQRERPLPREKFYIPGSVLRMRIDASQPLAWGMDSEADIVFDSSPVFALRPDAAAKGVKPIAWFGTDMPLRSGWAWGQQFLRDGLQALEASYGNGRVVLLAPEVAFRGQAHGTFKLLFNSLHVSTSQPARAP